MPDSSKDLGAATDGVISAPPSNPASERPSPRSLPDETRGTLAESEYVSRYLLAAGLAGGRNVLDVGCGDGYGTVLCVDAGAAHATGIDAEASVFPSEGFANCEFVAGGLQRLPFADGEFELTIAFDSLAGLDDPASALDELVRVTNPESGLILVSAPNREPRAADHANGRNELSAGELVALLQERFTFVKPLRQHNWLATAIFEDTDFSQDDPRVRLKAPVSKLHGGAPGDELYTLALAGNGAMPSQDSLVLLTQGLEVRKWTEQIQTYRASAEAAEAKATALDEELRVARAAFDERVTDLQERLAWVEEHDLFLREVAERNAIVRLALTIWPSFNRFARKLKRVLKR